MPSEFEAAGVITLTTDFGHKGPFAAVMKGVIQTRYRNASIIDLTHDIPAYWPPEAGFWISRSFGWFPRGTVHVAIVDPGVGTGRDIIVAELEGHAFMAPDNGLLASLLAAANDPLVYRLEMEQLDALGLPEPSLTFHGRDIFAPVAAEIAAGRLHPAEVGKRIAQWTPAWLDEPEATPGQVSGVVITVDAFGNLISNIDRSLIEPFANPIATVAGHSFGLRPTYGLARPGDYLALINSFGVLEIARAEGSAAAALGTDRGAPVVVHNAGTSTK